MDDWEAVAAAINSRMRELRMTQMELASRSGVSIATIRDLQHNRSPRQRRQRTLSALSTGLRWPSEHLERVLRGKIDGESAPTAPSAEFTEVMAHLDSIQEELRSVAHRLDRLEHLVEPVDDESDRRSPQGGRGDD